MPIKFPDINKTIEQQDADVLAVMLCWAEARGETKRAKRCVLHVVKNRVLHPSWWGKTLRDVVLKKWQFSSFNPDNPTTVQDESDPNRRKMLTPLRFGTEQTWQECWNAYHNVFVLDVPDITNGATHYYDTSILAPKWVGAKGTEFKLAEGHFRFYKAL